MRPARHLVIFAKEPRVGMVKTRLAADIGVVAAWAFYVRTLGAVTRRLSRDRRWHCWLAVTPDRAAGKMGSLAGVSIPQGSGDLGARMARPLDLLPPGPVVIVGTDVPDLGPRHVASGVENPLAEHRRHALADTLAGLPRDWSTAFLETLEDVDDGAALARYSKARAAR